MELFFNDRGGSFRKVRWCGIRWRGDAQLGFDGSEAVDNIIKNPAERLQLARHGFIPVAVSGNGIMCMFSFIVIFVREMFKADLRKCIFKFYETEESNRSGDSVQNFCIYL
jgi:hypothetical protein